MFIAAVLSLSVYVYTRRAGRDLPARPTSIEATHYVYFYDLATQAVFSGSRYDIPPVNTESDEMQDDGRPTGVRARVFSCGACDDESSRFVGYLETFTREAQDLQADIVLKAMELGESPRPLSPDEAKQVADGTRIAAEPGKQWFQLGTPESDAVIHAIESKCEAPKKARECFP